MKRLENAQHNDAFSIAYTELYDGRTNLDAFKSTCRPLIKRCRLNKELLFLRVSHDQSLDEELYRELGCFDGVEIDYVGLSASESGSKLLTSLSNKILASMRSVGSKGRPKPFVSARILRVQLNGRSNSSPLVTSLIDSDIAFVHIVGQSPGKLPPVLLRKFRYQKRGNDNDLFLFMNESHFANLRPSYPVIPPTSSEMSAQGFDPTSSLTSEIPSIFLSQDSPQMNGTASKSFVDLPRPKTPPFSFKSQSYTSIPMTASRSRDRSSFGHVEFYLTPRKDIIPLPYSPIKELEQNAEDESMNWRSTSLHGLALILTTWIVGGVCIYHLVTSPVALDNSELEEATGKPIFAYYMCLVPATAVVAWVWCIVSWVGMKQFRHAAGRVG